MVLFPKERIFNQVAQASHASTVSTFFLENLLKAKPEDTDLRLLLARHYLDISNMTEAKETLSVVLESADPNAWLRAQLLDLEILKIRTLALPEGSFDRREGMKEIGKHIEMLIGSGKETTSETLTQLAQSALLVGERNLAQSIYEQLGQRSGPRTANWYAKAAELALGRGAYQKAATLYFSAQSQTSRRQKQREYYIEALKALQAGNFLQEAIDQARQHLGELHHDEPTLFFLVSLGRAAGNGSFAQKYVKDLLRVASLRDSYGIIPASYSPLKSWTETSFVFAPLVSYSTELEFPDPGVFEQQWPGYTPIIAIGESPERTKVSRKSRFRPFDDRIYTLGYTVFLENQNLEDAFSLAKAAVQQAPHRLEWRKKYAQVAEWIGHQHIALTQWRKIAEKHPSQEPFEQILRLAPGAYDDENIIFALLGLGKFRTLSKSEWQELSDAYERIGTPADAVAYLTHLHRQNPDKSILEQIAYLYQRMGKGEQAYHYYRELVEQYGSSIAWATQQAGQLSLQGNLRDAYKTLQTVKSQASEDAHEYWKLVGHLAWTLEDDEQAEQAYKLLWAHDQLSMAAQERLILLIRRTRPDEAIEVSLAGWKTHHSPKFFIQALDLLLQEKKIAQLQSMLENLLPWEEDLVARNELYWVIRAEVMWKIGKKSEALRAYEQALTINPESSETKEAFLWFLVDQKNKTSLERYVSQWRDVIQADSRLWGPAAAAYVVLDQPKKSLPFFIRQLEKRKHDYLWLLNYAAALEAASQKALAWQVRQHAWVVIRKTLLARPSKAFSPETLEAFAMLASSKAPGDQLLTLLRQTRKRMTSSVMKELVLSWFLSQEAFDAAKSWLWNAYARQLSKPGWAKLALALAENDWESIHAIVIEHDEDLSRSDKVEAANQLEHSPLAQDLTFDVLTQQPNNDAAHFQYQEAITAAVDHITSGILFEDRRPLSSYVSKTAMPIQVGRVEVKPEAAVTWQESTDSDALTGVPRVDRQFGLSLRYRWPTGAVRVTGFHRNAVSNVVGLEMQYEQIWNARLTSTVTVGRNQKADDSILVQIGGVKDFIRGQGLYYFSKRQFGSLQLDAPRFKSQSRDHLGRGLGVEGVLGHHIRREYPDITIRLAGNVQRYWRVSTLPGSMSRLIPSSQDRNPIRVIPQNFSQGGVSVSVGDTIRDIYTKGIRPFGLIGMNYNSATGFGRSLELGIAARLLGQDRLVVFGSHIRGGFGQNATTTQINLEYQRWF